MKVNGLTLRRPIAGYQPVTAQYLHLHVAVEKYNRHPSCTERSINTGNFQMFVKHQKNILANLFCKQIEGFNRSHFHYFGIKLIVIYKHQVCNAQ